MIINIKDSFQHKALFNNHRCFVISECGSDDKHLAVNISGIGNRQFYDKSCILMPSDLTGYIYKASFIYYEMANELPHNLDINCEKIEISKEVLLKIQDGAKKSKHLPRKFKRYFDLFST